jgi:hypothetical protein
MTVVWAREALLRGPSRTALSSPRASVLRGMHASAAYALVETRGIAAAADLARMKPTALSSTPAARQIAPGALSPRCARAAPAWRPDVYEEGRTRATPCCWTTSLCTPHTAMSRGRNTDPVLRHLRPDRGLCRRHAYQRRQPDVLGGARRTG